ncbi:unnamed protein product [Lampetra fluviatilis]
MWFLGGSQGAAPPRPLAPCCPQLFRPLARVTADDESKLNISRQAPASHEQARRLSRDWPCHCGTRTSRRRGSVMRARDSGLRRLPRRVSLPTRTAPRAATEERRSREWKIAPR